MPRANAAQVGIASPKGMLGQPIHGQAQTAGDPGVYGQGAYDEATYADGPAVYDVTCYDGGRYAPLPEREKRARYGQAHYDRGARYG